MSRLKSLDPEVYRAITNELERQRNYLELIASENIVSEAVLEAQGSIFTNKYAEGYPSKRYYGGCDYADVIENLAIERARQLFQGGVCQCTASFRQPGKHGCLFCRFEPG